MIEPYEKNPSTEPPTLAECLEGLDSEELESGPMPVRVPLVIYIGEERRIIGDAVVKGNEIEAFIDPPKGRTLAKAIEQGVIDNVSVTFNPPPAVPVLNEDGHVQWRKTY